MLAALANHLWQSTIFALAAALLTLAFRKNRAQIRYALWLAASLKFLIPFALLIALGTNLWQLLPTKNAAPEIAAPVISQTIVQITQPVSDALLFTPGAHHATNWPLTTLIAVWACGFLAIAVMRLRAWLRIRVALRSSSQIARYSPEAASLLGGRSFSSDIPVPLLLRALAPEELIESPTRIRTAPGLLEPGVVGIFRPTLLLPEGILESLTPPQLEAVLAHELAHIRRRDNLTAALHMLVEAIFWFHPLVWWIGARLIEERERACDEAVLSLGNQPRDYAAAILQVCKLYVESPVACAAGVTGADLKERIHAILSDVIGIELTVGKKIALAGVALIAVILPVVVGALLAPVLRGQAAVVPRQLSFDVASIKPDPDPGHRSGHSIHIHENNGYYTATGVTAKYLIKDAYNLTSDNQLSGGPDWIFSDPYAIEAKFDAALEAKWSRRERPLQMRLLIRSLLADRFQLKISHRTKELPVFNLVIARGGPKIGPSTGRADHQSNDGHNEGDVEIYALKNEPIESLIDDLSREPEIGGRLVIDKTGLTGFYTFNWKWTRQSDNIVPADAAATDPPSLWTALQEQLGLRLQSAKGPVDTIVIDHIEKPTPN
ncbi:MAG: M56 family metallopeptidase [Candidatus Acidiferrales bacterium]